MTLNQTSIPCAMLRGGSSRAVYFLKEDLPVDPELRDQVLLAVAGGPDPIQVDGIGGGHPLSNKAAIVSRSDRDDADIDYLFLQITPAEGKVKTEQNCGNILAGVGPFAVETGLIDATSERTKIRVHMVNSGRLCELSIETPNGQVNYDGDTSIDGVPGSAAPIIYDFLDVAGSSCGALLPTGNVRDEIDGIAVTCIDNGMPLVIMRAEDLAVSGYETADELDANETLKSRLESLRLRAGPLMNLGNVAEKTVPKMCLTSAPKCGGLINTRTFIPHVCHRAIGVFGAVTVATACLLPGSVCSDLAHSPEGSEKTLSVEHPAGSFVVRIVVDDSAASDDMIKRAGVVRTARLIMRGQVFVPSAVWRGPEFADLRLAAHKQ